MPSPVRPIEHELAGSLVVSRPPRTAAAAPVKTGIERRQPRGNLTRCNEWIKPGTQTLFQALQRCGK
ncbi:hypothetical protein E2C01_101284 [Portunus trituberculatus]|uniref:Uncharacterized protein n=1 Tax=Portunus trituberculatus TaxID=210409 RepID=A0A5B7KF79_PORTR|nr:hypothetical protein [Portunus trituberculatus]